MLSGNQFALPSISCLSVPFIVLAYIAYYKTKGSNSLSKREIDKNSRIKEVKSRYCRTFCSLNDVTYEQYRCLKQMEIDEIVKIENEYK